MKAAIIAATGRGKKIAGQIKDGLPHNCDLLDVNDMNNDTFGKFDALIFVCAVQIAVRKIAPFVKSKVTDPAVVVCDEAGKWAISLLSGHIGGANELTKQAADVIGATPVITTASDVNNFPKEPKNIIVGIGCRKETSVEAIERAVTTALYNHKISIYRVCAVASIDLKRGEPGLLGFAGLYNLPLTFYSAEELKAVEGDFQNSDFVNETAGVNNVCERAAALRGGKGRMIAGKTAKYGVTVAAFEADE